MKYFCEEYENSKEICESKECYHIKLHEKQYCGKDYCDVVKKDVKCVPESLEYYMKRAMEGKVD